MHGRPRMTAVGHDLPSRSQPGDVGCAPRCGCRQRPCRTVSLCQNLTRLTSHHMNSPEAPDWPAPTLAVAFKANKAVDVRRRRYRTRPERLGREIPLGNRDLPITGIVRQYLANGLRRHGTAPMFSHHEELRHVVLNAFAVMRARVDQGEAGQPFLHADQQRVEAFVAPIEIEVGKRGIAALYTELEVRRARRLDLGEVVDIKLRKALDQWPLRTTGQHHAHGLVGGYHSVSSSGAASHITRFSPSYP